MTLNKYRLIDILILTVIGIIADWISYFASQWIFSEMRFTLYVAPSVLIIIFVMIRWDLWGIISQIILTGNHLLIYREELFVHHIWVGIVVAYLSLALILLWKKYKKTITSSNWKKLVFYFLIPFIVYVGVEVLTLFLLGSDVNLLVPLFRQLTNFVFLLIVMIIAIVQKDFLVDMKQYLIDAEKARLAKENDS